MGSFILWVFGKMDCDRHGDVVLWKRACDRLSCFVSDPGSPSQSLYSLTPGLDLRLEKSFLCKDYIFFFLPESAALSRAGFLNGCD